jgi:hypothetical protein
MPRNHAVMRQCARRTRSGAAARLARGPVPTTELCGSSAARRANSARASSSPWMRCSIGAWRACAASSIAARLEINPGLSIAAVSSLSPRSTRSTACSWVARRRTRSAPSAPARSWSSSGVQRSKWASSAAVTTAIARRRSASSRSCRRGAARRGSARSEAHGRAQQRRSAAGTKRARPRRRFAWCWWPSRCLS